MAEPNIITAEPIRSFGWFISFVGPEFKYSNNIGEPAPVTSGADGQPTNDALPAKTVRYNISRNTEPYRMPWGDVGAYSDLFYDQTIEATFYEIANFNGLHSELVRYLNANEQIKTIKLKKLLPNNKFYEGIVFHNCRPVEVSYTNMDRTSSNVLEISAKFYWEYATIYEQSEADAFRSDN
jgi:hypothetical protein